MPSSKNWRLLLDFARALMAMLIAVTAAYSQTKKGWNDPREKLLGVDTQWSEGSAMLDDGTELKGVLKYNEVTGVLSIEAGKDTRSLSARSCPGFEFYDLVAQKQRLFYTLESANDEGVVVPMFFEALFQFKSFAVLRKAGVMKIKEKNVYNPLAPTDQFGAELSPRTRTQYEQEETIYLMSERGEIKPWIEIVSKDKNIDMLDSERTRVQNEDFLEKLVGKTAYQDLEKYRRENKLSFKDREELVKLFEYYQDKWDR